MLTALDVMYQVSETQRDWMVGQWIGNATDAAAGDDDFTKDMFETNAKMLPTIWEYDSTLLWYAYRTYDGYIKDIFKVRWEAYLNAELERLRTGSTDIVVPDYRQLCIDWVYNTPEYSRTPKDDPASLWAAAQRVLTDCAYPSDIVYPENKDDLALYKPTYCTYDRWNSPSAPGGGYSSNLTDGNRITYWDGVDWHFRPEIVVDLLGTYQLDTIHVFPLSYGDRYYNYELYVSEDNVHWTHIVTTDKKTVDTDDGDRYDLQDVTGRYIKLIGTFNSVNEGFHITGLRAYGKAAEPAEVNVTASNMTLGNALAMNLMVKKADVPDLTGLSMQITKTFADGREPVAVTVPAAQWKDYNKDYYAVTFDDISAKEMTDEITAVILKDGQPVGDVYTDSVADYALRILRKQETKAELKSVIVDMLNYGAKAQKHFKYNENVLANAELTEAEQALASDAITAENVLVKGPGCIGSNLNLGSNMALTMYFKGITPDMHATVSYEKHNGDKMEVAVNGADFVKFNDTVYGIRANTLVVADAQQPVTVTVYDANDQVVASGTDSIASYLSRSTTIGELGQAILKFAASAEIYFANR